MPDKTSQGPWAQPELAVRPLLPSTRRRAMRLGWCGAGRGHADTSAKARRTVWKPAIDSGADPPRACSSSSARACRTVPAARRPEAVSSMTTTRRSPGRSAAREMTAPLQPVQHAGQRGRAWHLARRTSAARRSPRQCLCRSRLGPRLTLDTPLPSRHSNFEERSRASGASSVARPRSRNTALRLPPTSERMPGRREGWPQSRAPA